MERKTLLRYGLQIVRFDHLSRRVCDPDISAVQVLYHEVDTSQSLVEGDLLFEKNICTLPLKLLVGLFLYYNDDITRLDTGCLISLTMEGVLAFVRSTLVDHNIEDLLFFVDLFTFTRCASIGFIDNLTLTTAVIARALGLGVHTGP